MAIDYKFNLKNLDEGGFFVKPQFFDEKDFKMILNKVPKLKYKETYQPADTYYGNKYQAYPCWENDNKVFDKLFAKKIKEYFGREAQNLYIVVRKTLSSEVKKSKSNAPISFTHKDESRYAGVYYLDQTVTGGTAFFENSWDKCPDITMGAYPNRLVAYSGRRFHAAMHDFTFDTRYVIVIFFD
jgi:hypothetical protein